MLGSTATELGSSALCSSAQVRIDHTPALAHTKLSLSTVHISAHPYDRVHTFTIERTQMCMTWQAPFDNLNLILSFPIELGDWPKTFLGFLEFSSWCRSTVQQPKTVRMRSHLCFISLSIFCYFIRFRVLGYLCHILLGLGFWAINICL